MKIAFFGTGVPDPTQGGSGIMNYLISKYMLDNGYDFKAFFRANDNFINAHCNFAYLKELEKKGLNYEFVKDKKTKYEIKFGLNFILQQQQYEVCKKTVEQNRDWLLKCDGCISLDFGWAAALAGLKINKVCILGDPIERRFKFGPRPPFFSPRGLLYLLRRLSLWNIPNWYKKLFGNFDDVHSILAFFAAQETEIYKEMGLHIRHVKTFTKEPAILKKYAKPNEKLILLHMGSLLTSASREMLRYWDNKLLPGLSKLPFDLELRLVGKYDPKITPKSKWKNIHLNYLGYIDNADTEFCNAHAYFSPMKYPVGVRTRNISAMSYGLPVITDKTAALCMPETVAGQDTFYFSTPDEAFILLNKLYKNPSILERVGINARKSWEKYYNPKNNISAIVDLLK